MLHALSQQGVALSLITSNSRENVERILGVDNAALMKDPHYGTSLFGKSSKLKSVLKKTVTAPGEAIYIGDEVRDFEAAHAAGVDFGAVAWGYTHADTLRDCFPEMMFERIEEIAEKLS